MTKRVLTLVISLFAYTAAFAQTLPSLLVPGNAGLAGTAGVAASVNHNMVLNDIAASALYDGKGSIALGYNSWHPAVAADKLMYGNASVRFGRVGMSLSFKSFKQPGSNPVNNNGVSVRDQEAFDPSESVFGLGLSYAITNSLSLGITAHSISSKMNDTYRSSVVGIDAGLRYKGESFHAGAGVYNVGGKVNYGGADYDQPSFISADGAYMIGGLGIGAKVQYMLSGVLMASAGAEYAWKDLLFVRAGYHYGPTDKAVPSYVSVGVGVKLAGFAIDFAYLLGSNTLGGSLAIGLGYSF